MSLSFSHVERNAATGERTPVFLSPVAEAPIRLNRNFLNATTQLPAGEAQKAKDVLAISEAAYEGFKALAPRDANSIARAIVDNFIDTDVNDPPRTEKNLGGVTLSYSLSNDKVLTIFEVNSADGACDASLILGEAHKSDGSLKQCLNTIINLRMGFYDLAQAGDLAEDFFGALATKASPQGRAWLLETLREKMPAVAAPAANPESSLG